MKREENALAKESERDHLMYVCLETQIPETRRIENLAKMKNLN